jgi:hypothetical protein
MMRSKGSADLARELRHLGTQPATHKQNFQYR